jgi:cysteine-rich repeat protein
MLLTSLPKRSARARLRRVVSFLAAAILVQGLIFFATPLLAFADPVIFFGEDINTTLSCGAGTDNPDRIATPNSDIAHVAFIENLSGVAVEDFESFVDGANPGSLSFGSETATVLGGPEIKDVPTETFNGAFPISGDKLLFHLGVGSEFDIVFSNPQAAFGFYATDVGDGGAQLILTLTHDVGGPTTIPVPHATTPCPLGASTSGSAFYVGIVDLDNPFTQVTFANTLSQLDGFGFDDMTIAVAEQVLCGNSELDTGEECDDGNNASGDGCSEFCVIERFCGSVPEPELGCRQSGLRGGKLIIKDRTLRQRQVKVKWARGVDTTYDEFCEAADTQQLPDGNYHVCIYDDVDGTPELLLETVVRPGMQCSGKPCWKHKVGRKCKFKDKSGTIRGVNQLKLREGVSGKARWKLRAKGKDVPPPDLGETGRTFPMTVQMLIDDGSGNCWQTNYESAKKNDGEKLIAKK